MSNRPTWDEYFLAIAIMVATRADCTRREVGAVLVKDHRIIATGYNGAPAGKPGCLVGACPRGRLTEDECPPFSPYDNCIAVHAEANALLYADRDKCEGATLYITCEPCSDCSKLIAASGVYFVVFPGLDGRPQLHSV